MNRVLRTGSLALTVLSVSTGTSFAQSSLTKAGWPAPTVLELQAPSAVTPPAWGTASESVLTILASDINPPSSAVTYTTDWSFATGVGIHQTSNVEELWWTNVRLPSGALITKISMEACDTNNGGEVTFGLGAWVKPSGTLTPLESGTTGTSAMPGCGEFTKVLANPVMVDNFANAYVIPVTWSAAYDGSARLYAIRVYYKLQVSPAPATATFNDVPVGHPLHRFVEALFAAGITGGCGGGNFCPNDPLTRGQMAVFLSAALGLHFPN